MAPQQLKERLGLENLLNIPPRYNCAPLQSLPIAVKNRAGFARWGFRPEWAGADDPAMAAKMINARSETVHEKKAFRESWARGRRCIIPANGFYEWKKDEVSGLNQPYYIQPQDTDVLYLAGLWSKVDGDVSFTILTKAADGDIANIHHRSPVIVPEGETQSWFSGGHSDALDIIQSSSAKALSFYTVSSDVGKVANDHEGLTEEAEPLKHVGSLGI